MAVFSKDGYFKNTPVWVKKVSMSLKTIIGTIAGATYLSDNPKVAFWLLIAGAAIDEAMKFIKVEENEQS